MSLQGAAKRTAPERTDGKKDQRPEEVDEGGVVRDRILEVGTGIFEKVRRSPIGHERRNSV